MSSTKHHLLLKPGRVFDQPMIAHSTGLLFFEVVSREPLKLMLFDSQQHNYYVNGELCVKEPTFTNVLGSCVCGVAPVTKGTWHFIVFNDHTTVVPANVTIEFKNTSSDVAAAFLRHQRAILETANRRASQEFLCAPPERND